jgi:hypothetical protein
MVRLVGLLAALFCVTQAAAQNAGAAGMLLHIKAADPPLKPQRCHPIWRICKPPKETRDT